MTTESCGTECVLAPDVVAATYAPHERTPRTLTCEMPHPHPGWPHKAEGWAWENGSIWKVDKTECVSSSP